MVLVVPVPLLDLVEHVGEEVIAVAAEGLDGDDERLGAGLVAGDLDDVSGEVVVWGAGVELVGDGDGKVVGVGVIEAGGEVFGHGGRLVGGGGSEGVRG